jgi:hypothetical protein
MIRRLAAAIASLALLLALTVPVLAGGWAEIVADAQTTTEPPVEGQPLEVGFVVLQHGETPAGWETATVHFTNASTGQTVDVTATNDRSDGHFVATATLPAAGDWTWKVTLKDLASEHAPVALTVQAATGQAAAASSNAGGFPVIALLALVLVIGAIAAFAIAWRARRSRPDVKVSPAPRGADPA